MEIETEVIRLGNDYCIPLPLSFIEGTTLQEGTVLKIKFNERGNIEVGVNKAPTQADAACQICGKGTARYECSHCHTVACSNCFWEWGGLCNQCVKK